MKLLDALFLCFDKLSEQFQLVKIETVFETYLAAAGKAPRDQLRGCKCGQMFAAAFIPGVILAFLGMHRFTCIMERVTQGCSLHNSTGRMDDSLVYQTSAQVH